MLGAEKPDRSEGILLREALQVTGSLKNHLRTRKNSKSQEDNKTLRENNKTVRENNRKQTTQATSLQSKTFTQIDPIPICASARKERSVLNIEAPSNTHL